MTEKFNDSRDWFSEKKLGMFIHWGIYAIPGIHEQYWQRWHLSRKEYVKFAKRFNPKKFNPAEWLDIAQEAGMEYMCFTTKHHDGFCMWDTKQTDFNIMNTPYMKDVLAMLSEECHKRDFPLELYYSVVDWHHPAYPNIGRHHEIKTDTSRHDMAAYMEYLKAQIREICTNYGTIYGIWWDMNVPEHKDPSIHQLIHELQPYAVINNRGFDEGDYSTPERDWDPEGGNTTGGKRFTRVEACQSVGVNSWGYRKNEDYFSSRYLMESIDHWLSNGANYLLNVGPDTSGRIPAKAKAILKDIGKWMRNVRPSFEGTPEKILQNQELRIIRDGKTIYAHCTKEQPSSTISLKPLSEVPESVILMNTGKPLPWTFEPLVYENQDEKFLRVREIDHKKLNGPAVIKISFP